MKQGRLTIFLLITLFVGLVLSGCQSAQSQLTEVPTPVPPTATAFLPTATLIPPTLTPVLPTLTPTQTIILASDQPIKIGNYSILLNNVRLEDIGWNPLGLASNLAFIVGVEEESGKIDELVSLGVWFTDDQGVKFENIASETGTNYLGVKTLSWNIWINEPAKGYFMHFPSGEVIDLTALLK